jgi:hypothetical protein
MCIESQYDSMSNKKELNVLPVHISPLGDMSNYQLLQVNLFNPAVPRHKLGKLACKQSQKRYMQSLVFLLNYAFANIKNTTLF